MSSNAFFQSCSYFLYISKSGDKNGFENDTITAFGQNAELLSHIDTFLLIRVKRLVNTTEQSSKSRKA